MSSSSARASEAVISFRRLWRCLMTAGAFECLVELVRAFGSACPSLLRGEPISPKELF